MGRESLCFQWQTAKFALLKISRGSSAQLTQVFGIINGNIYSQTHPKLLKRRLCEQLKLCASSSHGDCRAPR